MHFHCVRTLAPIASQARHFPPISGEADTKEKGNYIFYYFYIRIYVYLLPDSYRSRWSGMASHCILGSLRS